MAILNTFVVLVGVLFYFLIFTPKKSYKSNKLQVFLPGGVSQFFNFFLKIFKIFPQFVSKKNHMLKLNQPPQPPSQT